MQQKLGRRIDTQPYYTIAARSADRLVLVSHPGANRRPGQVRAISGALLVLAAIVLFFSGFAWNAQALGGSFGGVLFSALLAGLLGGAGYRRLIGGIAIASTRNTLTVDLSNQSIIYTQYDRISGERQQTLPLGTVTAIDLREQRLLSGGLLQRRLPIAVLGLQTQERNFWIVDSAAEARHLEELKAAFEELLGKTS
jgi:hypothetical protein